jgi:DNA-binding response OmpR family regulator
MMKGEQYPVNLIILDIIIRYINGLELCRRIKMSKPEIPILMITALGATDDKVTGMDKITNMEKTIRGLKMKMRR